MKVIFLDIDGVLNNQDTFINRYYKKQITGYYDLEIDHNMVLCLKKIVEPTNSLIVLTSSWRNYFIYENNILKSFDKGKKLVDLLKQYNLTIYDITPFDIMRYRGNEISIWLSEHNVDNYIIIDDESYDLIDFLDKLVLCDKYGLTNELADVAIKKLLDKNDVKTKIFRK